MFYVNQGLERMFKIATLIKTVMLITLIGGLLGKLATADEISIKKDAPITYVVKKGDTLWDISNIFLERPWLWPELWRNNTQIENPHLIYPGDRLQLTFNEAGEPTLELVRNKSTIVLSPNASSSIKPVPIELLPWSTLGIYANKDSLMTNTEYSELPALLGDKYGTPVFIEQDFILTRDLPESNTHYQVVRKVREVVDSTGKRVGVQVNHLSDAHVSNSLTNDRHVVRLAKSNLEARPGDKVMPAIDMDMKDIVLQPAINQEGEIIQNLSGNVLISHREVVIVNLGESEVAPGTVFGVYQRGPDVLAYDKPKYKQEGSFDVIDAMSFADRVEQPAFKVGELVIIRTFEKASYAWVTQAETWFKGGEIIAKP